MRAFIALALPEAVRDSLGRLQEELRTSRADVKWVESENLHVTMRFLGEVTQAQGESVKQLVERTAAASPPVRVSLHQVGAFPSVQAARVVWVGVEEGKDELTRLAEQIEEGCRALGLAAEERPFAAHVTLGRVRSPKRRRELSEALARLTWEPPVPWEARALALFQSILTSSGPRYTALAQLPFAGSG
jgi:2'-5' RNA ligase